MMTWMWLCGFGGVLLIVLLVVLIVKLLGK